tara:strand:+ start:1369 stop:4050 length:2682 start_codon:yes stop_codon:yes gene_type:complete
MFHAKTVLQTAKRVKTDTLLGLEKKEVERRQEKDGKNTLPESKEKVTKAKVFFDQWKSPLIIVLVLASAVSGFLGETTDMAIIFITAFLNAVIGFFQEYKANKALEKLQSLVEYTAVVMRDGTKVKIPNTELVVGDIVFLTAGDLVPADGRLIRSVELQVNEAPLTGESQPVQKHTKVLKKEMQLAERKNMVFSGTIVTDGEATCIVTGIGSHSEIGQIATLVKETKEEQTPLQKQLATLAKYITYIIILIAGLIFCVGLLFGGDRYTLLELSATAIAVAVAAIPEGLVISLTVILAIGMQYILQHKALIRKLVAAETLGSVSVICTDKTGTLTEGKMRVTDIITADKSLHMSQFSSIRKHPDMHTSSAFAIKIGVLCNNSVLQNPKESEKKWSFIGDPTESALVFAGMRAGIEKHHIDRAIPRKTEIPFSSEYMYMATAHAIDNEEHVYIKGAPEVLLEKATQYQDGNSVKKMTEKQREWFAQQAKMYAGQGYRTLALAYKEIASNNKGISEKDVQDSIFVGIVAMSDPLRVDVKKTINIAKKAGIRVIMITGDHVSTAQAIAYKLGLPSEEGDVCDGSMLEKMDEKEIKQIVKQVSVFARVDPKHKIHIVQALKEDGDVVAMTGDGVNDAPAIKAADIGIAVDSGTVVAKETADMVLLDDSFSTIVSAVREGRGIYQNIKKVVLYLLSGSFAEVTLITGSILIGYPVAALPGQILWINIVEDAFPVMALAFDRGDKENMKDAPRKKNDPIVDKEMRAMIIVKSIFANIILFSLFIYFYNTTEDIVLTRTIVFVGFGVDALFYIFAIRSLRKPFWHTNPFSNPYLILSVLFGWCMLVLAVYWGPLQKLLKTVPLISEHWVILLCFGLFNLFLMELIKGIFLFKQEHKFITTS